MRVGVVCGVRRNWYSQCPGSETHLALAIEANSFLLRYPCCLLWLCSQGPFLMWLFLTLLWFDRRFGFVLWSPFSQREAYQWLNPVHWSLTTGFGAKVPAGERVPLPPFVLSEYRVLHDLVGRSGWQREGLMFLVLGPVQNQSYISQSTNNYQHPLWTRLGYRPGTRWWWAFLFLLAPSPYKSRGMNSILCAHEGSEKGKGQLQPGVVPDAVLCPLWILAEV